MKEDNTYVGDLGFKGPVDNYAVEVGYGVLKKYEGNGYTIKQDIEENTEITENMTIKLTLE